VDGIFVSVRLTPKGGREAIDGIERLSDGRAVLLARVRAAPTGGKANVALVRLLARTLDVAPRQVDLVAGAATRVKRIKIVGDRVALVRALERIVGTGKA
jgi:uncharacterized protein (TIGR00251 family)